MPKKFYQVIVDKQIVDTRSSDRDYTHAVVRWVSKRWNNAIGAYYDCERHAAEVSYCGSLDLAQKRKRHENEEIVQLTVRGK